MLSLFASSSLCSHRLQGISQCLITARLGLAKHESLQKYTSDVGCTSNSGAEGSMARHIMITVDRDECVDRDQSIASTHDDEKLTA